MKFHSILKARRKALGMTQQEIADLFGIKSVNVSDWERDAFPETKRLPVLARKLGLTISGLFGESVDVVEKPLHPKMREVCRLMEELDENGMDAVLVAVRKEHQQYKLQATQLAVTNAQLAKLSQLMASEGLEVPPLSEEIQQAQPASPKCKASLRVKAR